MAESPCWHTLISRSVLLFASSQDRVQSWGQAEPTGRTEEAFLPKLNRKGRGARRWAGLSQQIFTEASQLAGWLYCLGKMLVSESKLCDSVLKAHSDMRKCGQEAWSSTQLWRGTL